MSEVKLPKAIPYTCTCERKVTFNGVEVNPWPWRCGVKGHLDITGGCGADVMLTLDKSGKPCQIQ